jgi:putative transposase
MKRKNFPEAQIVSILRMQESSRSVKEICREHGISDATFLQLEGYVRKHGSQ